MLTTGPATAALANPTLANTCKLAPRVEHTRAYSMMIGGSAAALCRPATHAGRAGLDQADRRTTWQLCCCPEACAQQASGEAEDCLKGSSPATAGGIASALGAQQYALPVEALLSPANST